MYDSTSDTSYDNVDSSVNTAFKRAEQGTMELNDLLATAGALSKDESIQLYRLWLEHTTSPHAFVAFFNLGVALSSSNDYVAAEEVYRKALEFNPDLFQARLNLGSCLEQQSRVEEALEQWKVVANAINISKPENRSLQLHALNNLGRLLEITRQFKTAFEMLDKSFVIDPTQRDVLIHLVHLKQKICKWPIYTPPEGISSADMKKYTSPLAMLAISDDPALQLLSTRLFVEYKFPVTTAEPLSPRDGYNHDKIRIGYLSSDLSMHAVSLLTVELFEQHNRDKFEVYGFCWSREDGTAFRKRVIAAMDHFITIGGMDDREAAETIRYHEIDVIVDLHGLTSGARPLILSYRPAPMQVTYLGFPGPTGLQWIDYVIADRYLIPEKTTQYFTEKPLYMPHGFQVSDSKREVAPKPLRAEYFLPDDAFVFCSFNNNYKYTEEVFAAWMRILKKVHKSVLWLLADNEWAQENLVKTAKKHGIKKERLIFAPRVVPAAYLARYQLADLFLDTFPFNGGTTANDALFMGLPILTLSGRSFASRMAGSLLLSLGLPDLITTNIADYEAKAVSFAKRPKDIEAARKRLANRAANAIFDTRSQARDLEKLFLQSLNLQEAGGVTRNGSDSEMSIPIPSENRNSHEVDKMPLLGNGVMMKLPELTNNVNPMVVRNFHSNVCWGISDPEKFASLMREAAKLVTPGYYLGDNLFTWGRNNSLFGDSSFLESWQKNAINSADQAIAWRRYILVCSACHCIQMEGDFVECGVYQGSGIKTVIDYFGVSNFNRNFWGYDTFDYHPVSGHAFAGQKDGLFDTINKRFEGYSQVKLVRGLLPDSLEQNSPDKISYLHIDLNSAKYEIAVLDKLFDRVAAGGMIILDDYEWAGIYREQKILEDAWFEKRNYRVFPLPTGQGFVLKR